MASVARTAPPPPPRGRLDLRLPPPAGRPYSGVTCGGLDRGRIRPPVPDSFENVLERRHVRLRTWPRVEAWAGECQEFVRVFEATGTQRSSFRSCDSWGTGAGHAARVASWGPAALGSLARTTRGRPGRALPQPRKAPRGPVRSRSGGKRMSDLRGPFSLEISRLRHLAQPAGRAGLVVGAESASQRALCRSLAVGATPPPGKGPGPRGGEQGKEIEDHLV